MPAGGPLRRSFGSTFAATPWAPPLKAGLQRADISPVGVQIAGEAPAQQAEARPATKRRDPRSRAGAALVVLAALLFVGHGLRTIGAPFGDSHDGRNAGVWAAGSRNLRESGPAASRLGTRSPENGVYANHPPLIYVETAMAEAVGLGSRAATRAPAWLGSLAVIVLLGRLLRERGLRGPAVGVALLLAAATPMFLVYGTMLDTPVTSLPFGAGLLLLWERARRGDQVHPVVAGVVAALAVLAGWQSVALAVLVGAWALVRVLRRTGRNGELGFTLGTAAGGVLLMAWLLWAFGGTLRPLVDQFLFRTGRSGQGVSVGAVFAGERRDLLTMFGPIALLAGAGVLAGLANARTRGVVGLALAVTLPYPFVFRAAAVNHDYWGYWFLLPVAVGLAAGGDVLLRWWAAWGRPQIVPIIGASLVAAVLVVGAVTAPSTAEVRKLRGFSAARALEGRSLPEGQPVARYAGAVGEPATWLGWTTGRRAELVPASQYEAVAGAAPAELVLVGEVRCVAGADHRSYELRPASSLLDRPPAIQPCP